MQNKLNKSIQQFKTSKNSLEAYQAISDFIEIVETVPEFIKHAEEEGEKIRVAFIELNADKGYELSYADRKEHNRRRGQKADALHQLNPMFPLINLRNVHIGVQPENIMDNTDWLFHRFGPDDPLPESDRKEYQLFLDKTYKNITPFLDKEILKEDTERKGLDFNSEKSILYFNEFEIGISSRNGKTNGHYILKHIFNSEEGLNQEYPYAEIASDEFNDEYDETNSWRKYHHACEYTNEKIRKITGIDNFLQFSTGKTGSVKINKKYLV